MAITDTESARAWLERQNQQTQIAFAARCSLRYATGLGWPPRNKNAQELIWPSLRCLLTASVIAANPMSENKTLLRRAAAKAGDDAAEADNGAVSSADICACAAYSAQDRDGLGAGGYAVQTTSTLQKDSADFEAADADATYLSETARGKTNHASVFEEPLWPMKLRSGRASIESSASLQGYTQLLAFFESDPAWGFWKRWLHGMRTGQPMDWAMQEKFALIPDEVWEAGPEAVAEEISRIETAFEPRTLQAEAATSQAERLIQQGQTPVLVAKGMSQLIQMAVQAYLREVENRLPGELEPLERLPPLLDQITLEIAGAGSTSPQSAELADLLQTMATTIAVLNQRLSRANVELEAAKTVSRSSAKTLMRDSFYSKLGERGAVLITSPMLWGGIATGTGFLLGSDAHALIKVLGECYDTTIAPHAPSTAPLVPTLPSTEQV